MSRQVSESGMRLRSSAGMTFSQTGLGTMPNIAPPSSLNVPSLTAWSSKSPSLCMIASVVLRVSPLYRQLAPPQLRREERAAGDRQLAEREEKEGDPDAVREPVGMETDAQLIDAEPGPAHHDVAEDRE